MNQELKEVLEEIYKYAKEAQMEDHQEAETAYNEGDMQRYFDLSLYLQLSDCCWALEKWDEADYWYNHNARIFKERREWLIMQGKPDEEINTLLDWEAATCIRAGWIREGSQLLQEAIPYFQKKPGNEIVLTMLGLHAAQAGLNDLSRYGKSVISLRNQMVAESAINEPFQNLLHYEPAMCALLLQDVDTFIREIGVLESVKSIFVNQHEKSLPADLHSALVAASEGFIAMADSYKGNKDPGCLEEAVHWFELGMLHFYKFSGQLDSDIYFMRLAGRLARQLQ
jgi:hypothetical protein